MIKKTLWIAVERGRQADLHYAHLSPSLRAAALIGLTWTPSLCWLPQHIRLLLCVVPCSSIVCRVVFMSRWCSCSIACLSILNLHSLYLLLISCVILLFWVTDGKETYSYDYNYCSLKEGRGITYYGESMTSHIHLKNWNHIQRANHTQGLH